MVPPGDLLMATHHNSDQLSLEPFSIMKSCLWRVHPSNPEHASSSRCFMTALSRSDETMRDENKHPHASQKHISRRWHTQNPAICINASFFSVLCGVCQSSHDWRSWKPGPRCGWASFSKQRQHMSLQIPRHRATPDSFKSQLLTAGSQARRK